MNLLPTEALRHEARENLRLALPIVIAQFTFMGMGTVDTIMAGRLGADALAAVAVGANVWFLLFIVFTGILLACSPIVAQRLGAGRQALEIGDFVRETAVLAVGLGLAWTLAMRLAAGPVVDLLALDPRPAADAKAYIRVVSWAAVPFCLCFLLRNVAEAHGLPRAALAAGLVGFCVNTLFDYLLMFGRLGFPALGPVGSAWASLLAALAMLATYLLLYHRLNTLRALQLLRPGWPRPRPQVREVLRLGLPIAAIIAAEAWMFNIGALLMARFGGEVIAAHQVAINVASLAFMVPLSIGFATTVRVGHAAGGGDVAGVRLRGQTGMLLGIAFAVFSASLMALFPEAIVALYTDAPKVSALAVAFLGFAAVFQIFDCIQATANGALRGIKDTRMPMLITLAAYWIVGMPAAWFLTFHTAQGPRGVWWGFIIALAIAAAGLAPRFLLRTRGRLPPPDDASVLMP